MAIDEVGLGDKFAMVGTEEYKGRTYFCVRYLYESRTEGGWKPSTNGINVPVEDAEQFLQVALEAYNKHFGTNLVIADASPTE